MEKVKLGDDRFTLWKGWVELNAFQIHESQDEWDEALWFSMGFGSSVPFEHGATYTTPLGDVLHMNLNSLYINGKFINVTLNGSKKS